MYPEQVPRDEASPNSLLSQVFSPQALGTEKRRELDRRAQWRLVANCCSNQPCVEWWLVSGGSRSQPDPEGQEERFMCGG